MKVCCGLISAEVPGEFKVNHGDMEYFLLPLPDEHGVGVVLVVAFAAWFGVGVGKVLGVAAVLADYQTC